MYEDQQRTRPYGNTGRVFLHQFKHGSPGRGPLIFAIITGLLGLAVSAASLTLLLSYKSTAQAQVRQLQRAVASAQAATQGRASQVDSQAAKISRLDTAMAAIAQFSTVCSQYLTGPNGGPTTFYFPCSDVKPGG